MPSRPQRPLRGLLISQFLGAFNDNCWKLAVAMMAIGALPVATEPGANEARIQTQTTITFVVFTLPLMLCSLPAGVFADRWSKRSVIMGTKIAEVVLMALGALSLWWRPEQTLLPLVILGLMGMQSAVFSPAKYGILPEILPHEKLTRGNAALELWTFLAIIAGTAAGGLLLDRVGEQRWIAGVVLTGLAVVGLLASLEIPRVARARSTGGLTETITTAWRAIRADRVLWLAVIGSGFYWAIISLLGQDVLVYARTLTAHRPHADALAALPLAIIGIGIGLGAYLAARLSGAKVEFGLIPLGAILLTLVTAMLAWFAPGFGWLLVFMVFVGIACGLLAVPLNAVLQWRAPADRRGAVIALANVFVFAGTLAGTLVALPLTYVGVSTRGILITCAALILAGTIWALWLLPEADAPDLDHRNAHVLPPAGHGPYARARDRRRAADAEPRLLRRWPLSHYRHRPAHPLHRRVQLF